MDGLLPLMPPDGAPVLDGQLGFQLPRLPLFFAIAMDIGRGPF